MKREYTEKQQKFLDVLFEQAKGDLLVAKRLAGYSASTPTNEIVKSLEDEIFELTKKYITRSATKAAYAMGHVLDNPTDLGNKEKLAAAKEILDRGGFSKTEKVEVQAETPLFILPAKKEDD